MAGREMVQEYPSRCVPQQALIEHLLHVRLTLTPSHSSPRQDETVRSASLPGPNFCRGFHVALHPRIYQLQHKNPSPAPLDRFSPQELIMSPVKNNVGRGLNIVLVDGTKGAVLTQKSFDMYSGDASLLVKFLKEISGNMLVLVASYDDPGTKMNEEIRKLFSNLGSTHAKQLGFRDSWVFLGAQDLQSKSPFEQFLKNNPETNKYDGWPELLELEGCVPRKKLRLHSTSKKIEKTSTG
nr:protein FAM3D isoform X2 [Ovis aries]